MARPQKIDVVLDKNLSFELPGVVRVAKAGEKMNGEKLLNVFTMGVSGRLDTIIAEAAPLAQALQITRDIIRQFTR